jgi:hypothetical protein
LGRHEGKCEEWRMLGTWESDCFFTNRHDHLHVGRRSDLRNAGPHLPCTHHPHHPNARHLATNTHCPNVATAVPTTQPSRSPHIHSNKMHSTKSKSKAEAIIFTKGRRTKLSQRPCLHQIAHLHVLPTSNQPRILQEIAYQAMIAEVPCPN